MPQLRGVDAGADLTSPALTVLQASLAERLAALRGVAEHKLPGPLLDIAVFPVELPGGTLYVVRPRDWEALRDEEGAAGRPVPYWARIWPSAELLALELANAPPGPGTRVLELGCGLGLPSLVAARAGAAVLATDGHEDAIAFTAHALALNELEAEVAQADLTEHADALAARGPFDLVLASDILYTSASADAAARLLPGLLEPNGELLIADPDRAGARRFLAAARASFHLRTQEHDELRLHRLRPR